MEYKNNLNEQDIKDTPPEILASMIAHWVSHNQFEEIENMRQLGCFKPTFRNLHQSRAYVNPMASWMIDALANCIVDMQILIYKNPAEMIGVQDKKLLSYLQCRCSPEMSSVLLKVAEDFRDQINAMEIIRNEYSASIAHDVHTLKVCAVYADNQEIMEVLSQVESRIPDFFINDADLIGSSINNVFSSPNQCDYVSLALRVGAYNIISNIDTQIISNTCAQNDGAELNWCNLIKYNGDINPKSIAAIINGIKDKDCDYSRKMVDEFLSLDASNSLIYFSNHSPDLFKNIAMPSMKYVARKNMATLARAIEPYLSKDDWTSTQEQQEEITELAADHPLKLIMSAPNIRGPKDELMKVVVRSMQTHFGEDVLANPGVLLSGLTETPMSFAVSKMDKNAVAVLLEARASQKLADNHSHGHMAKFVKDMDGAQQMESIMALLRASEAKDLTKDIWIEMGFQESLKP